MTHRWRRVSPATYVLRSPVSPLLGAICYRLEPRRWRWSESFGSRYGTAGSRKAAMAAAEAAIRQPKEATA